MAENTTGPLTRKDVIAQAKTGGLEGRSLAGLKLAKADLSEGKLRNIDAAGANLRRAVLRGADLAGANLAGADLQEADFDGADLSGADLTGAKVNQAHFIGAKLTGAKAGKAIFDKVVFRNADLAGADFTGALCRTARFESCSLVRAEFAEVDAAETILTDVDLTGANLRGAIFRECRFARVIAADVSGPDADFSFGELKAVNFSRAELTAARFFGAILKDLDFGSADLTDALFKRSQHRAVNFQNANLKNALMRGVYGCREKDLLVLQQQGAIIDRFLFRRFVRLLWRSLIVKIVAAAVVAALIFAGYRFLSNPYNWSYDILREKAGKLYQKGYYAKGEELDRIIIEKFARDRSRVADARLGIADSYRARRQFSEALKMYQEIATTYEGDHEAARALESMAAVYLQLDQTEQARAVYEKLRGAESGNPEAEANAEFGLADLLKKEGRNEEALAAYRAIFDKYRFDPVVGDRALYESIRLLCQFNRVDEAEATVAQLENYDASPPGQAMRLRGAMEVADMLRRRGDMPAAEQRYRAIFEKYKDYQKSRDAGARLTELCLTQGRVDEAEAQLAEMMKRATTDEAREDLILLQARLFAATRRTDKAIALLTAKLPGFEDRGRLFDGEAALLQMQADKGDLPAVEKTYQRIMGKFGGDADRVVDVKTVMSRVYAGHGQSEKAQAILRDIIAHPSRPAQVSAAKLELADQYYRAGAVDQAQRLYRELYDAKAEPGPAFLAGVALVEAHAAHGKFTEAEAQLADMEARWPAGSAEHSVILLRRVNVLQRSGKFDEAIARLLRAAQEMPEADKRRDVNATLLSLYIAAENLAGAEQTWSTIRAESGGFPDAILKADTAMAQFYASQGKRDKAEALFREIAAKYPNSTAAMQAQLDLAAQCRQAGDFDRAEKICRGVLTEAADPVISLAAGLMLADMLTDRRSFDEAQKVLEELRRKWAGDDERREDLVIREVRVQRSAGKPEAAAALLQRELPNFRGPGAADAFFLLLDLLTAAGDVKGAEDSLKLAAKVLGDKPDRLAFAKFQLGLLYANRNSADKAVAAFDEVARQYPQSEAAARAKIECAGLLRRRGDLAGAEKIYRDLADTLRDPVHAFGSAAAVADILAEQRKFAEADKQLETMLKKFGDRADFRSQIVFRRVQFARQQGRDDDALAALRQSIPTLDAARAADGNVMLMEMYAARGDVKSAEDAFHEVVKAAGDDADRIRRLKMALARMYVQHEQVGKGAALYKEIIEARPSDEIAAQARLSLAAALRTHGDRAGAEKLLRELLADKSAGSQAVAAGGMLVEVLADGQRLDDADAVLVELLKRPSVSKGDRADIVLWRARLFQRRQKDSAAIALVNEELPRIAEPKKKADAYGFLMDVYRHRNDMNAIETAYNAALKDLAGENAILAPLKIYFGQVCVEKEMFAKALPIFAEVATENPHGEAGLTARLEIGGVQRKMGDAAKAEQTYRELLAEPGDSSTSFAAGLLYCDILRDAKRLDEMDKLLAAMRAKWPRKGRERDEIAFRQARLLRQMERPAAQVAAFVEAEIKDVDDRDHLFDNYLLLMDIYQTAGDAKKAEAVYAKIQEVFGSEPARLARAKEMLKRP